MDKIADFEFVEENAKDAPVKDIKWYGKEDRTNDQLMHDVGKGDPVVIRLFEWKFPPNLEKLPVKEEILTEGYMKQLQNQLWADGLRLVLEPRVVIEKEGCKIFVPCQARTGQTFIETPKLLQEWI